MTAEWICFIRDGAFYRIVIKIRWDIYFSLLYVNITTSTTTAMQSYQELYTHKCILAHISINISTFPQSICICRGSRGGWWGRSRTWRRSRPRQRSRTRRGTCRCRTPGPIRGEHCSHVTSYLPITTHLVHGRVAELQRLEAAAGLDAILCLLKLQQMLEMENNDPVPVLRPSPQS